MKTILTMTAAATVLAGAAYAQTTIVTTPSTTVQEVQTDSKTSGGGAAGGAASGAIAGAVVGGPVGAAVGGLAGAVMGDASEAALTPETRTYITEHRTESVVLDSSPTVGMVIPESAPVQAVPNTQYQYVYINDRPVLVEPGTRKVVHIYE